MTTNIITQFAQSRVALVFLFDKQNEKTLGNIMEQTSSAVTDLFIAPIQKTISWTSSEFDRLSKKPEFPLFQAMKIIKEVIPDILENKSLYWDKIQPLPKYLDNDSISEAEEQLNLALGLGLEPLETAMSNFMLMSLWITRKISQGEIRWTGGDFRT